MGINWFDFHLHSFFSDGRLCPEDLIRECKREGMKIVALTDHENIKGIPWAISEGKELGVEVIPGIEFSAELCGGEHHFIGLAIDYRSAELAEFIRNWEVTKNQQIAEMVGGLKNLGFKVSFSDVAAQSCGALNRAHIAYAIWERPENSAVFERHNLKNLSDFFARFLKESSPVYVKRKMPSVVEVIRLIKALGGQAVWAHPFWRKDAFEFVLKQAAFLKTAGLDGLEVGYSADFQSRMETASLHQIARKLSLFETAGSDFHSFEMPVLNKIGNFEITGLELTLPREISRCFT